MAKFTLDGEEIEIPKFKFREIKAAAPFIDRVIARRKKLASLDAGMSREALAEQLGDMGSPMETIVDTLSDYSRIIAVGILHARGLHPYSVTSIEAQAELIEAELNIDDFGTLNTVFDDIAKEAGMIRPNPPKPPEEGAESDPPGNASTA